MGTLGKIISLFRLHEIGPFTPDATSQMRSDSFFFAPIFLLISPVRTIAGNGIPPESPAEYLVIIEDFKI